MNSTTNTVACFLLGGLRGSPSSLTYPELLGTAGTSGISVRICHLPDQNHGVGRAGLYSRTSVTLGCDASVLIEGYPEQRPGWGPLSRGCLSQGLLPSVIDPKKLNKFFCLTRVLWVPWAVGVPRSACPALCPAPAFPAPTEGCVCSVSSCRAGYLFPHVREQRKGGFCRGLAVVLLMVCFPSPDLSGRARSRTELQPQSPAPLG